MHDTDNEAQQFNFDACHESSLSGFATSTMLAPASTNPDLELTFSHDDSTSQEQHDRDKGVWGKGKGVIEPIPIHLPPTLAYGHFDPMKYSSSMILSTSASSHQSFQSTSLTPSSFHEYLYTDALSNFPAPAAQEITNSAPKSWPLNADCAWKGKERELPPILPPLDFSPSNLNPDESFWSSSIPSPGPSSYTSSYSQHIMITPRSADGFEHEPTSQRTEPEPSEFAALTDIPSRGRSLSNSTSPSFAGRSMSRVRSKQGYMDIPGEVSPHLRLNQVETEGAHANHAKINTTLNPRYSGLKADELGTTISRLSHLHYHDQPQVTHKGRSNSCPVPLSALDYIPVTSTDLFAPLPLVVKNLFEDILPRELRLIVLASLISLHEEDHLRVIRDERWCVGKASSSRGRWVGRDKGIRELVKFSRVSRSWQTLVFDGQLWADIDLHSFPIPPESTLRLTKVGGSFTQSVNIAGHVRISSDTFIQLTNNLCDNVNRDSLSYTQLTAINLQGCISLTTRSLHFLLMRSPCLETICLKGLTVVTNTTCNMLSTYCPNLVSLNMNRCLHIDADGIRSLASTAISRGEHLPLKHLRLCGLKNIDDSMMRVLGKAAPHLEVLDLSYGRQLHNSAIEAFVAYDGETASGDSDPGTVLISPRDLGREPKGVYRLKRRVTRLRHLSLSYCILLTDETCSNLAHSVPDLEFLEMAGIGSDLKDEGLIRLLNTTPKISRLDLEDASEITDDLLATLTPNAACDKSPPDSEPGHALEHFNASYATHLSDSALLALIHGCTRLKHLEVDNTRIGSAVLSDFVHLSRQRKTIDAKVMVVDCRGVSEPLVNELSLSTRPRMGWRAHAARKLCYLDARDGSVDELKVGQDECDEMRVVLKSFYSWQTVDVVKGVREKRRKSSLSGKNGVPNGNESGGRVMRWWSPGSGRTRSGSTSPLSMAESNNDGCIVM